MPSLTKVFRRLREIAPNARIIAVRSNPSNPLTGLGLQDVRGSVRHRIDDQCSGRQQRREIDTAFATLTHEQPDAFMVINDPLLSSRRIQIALLATRLGVPAVFSNREYAEAGGLMSYATSISEVYHQLGLYTGRILRGMRPAELPVVQSTGDGRSSPIGP